MLISIILLNPLILTIFGTIILLIAYHIKISTHSTCGVSIENVIEGTPAEESGITNKQVILSIDDTHIVTMYDFYGIMNMTSPGDTIVIGTYEKDSKEGKIDMLTEVTLGSDQSNVEDKGFLGIYPQQYFHKNCIIE